MKRTFLILLAALSATLSHAQTEKPHSVRVSNVCGPYLQNVTTTGFTVMWISDVDAAAWVEVAPQDGTHFYHEERARYYDLSGCGVKPLNKIHKVRIDGLQPGTGYRYRIMMKPVDRYYSQLDITYGREYGAPVYQADPPVARTLDEDYRSVKFSVVNDIHARDSVLRRLYSDRKKIQEYDFVLFNGDMTSDISEESKIVRHYLKPASDIFAAATPLYMVRGNHEFRGRDAIKLLDYFDFPDRKPYYTFKYGKFFFIVLDSGEDKPDSDIEYQEILCTDPYLKMEAEWLRKVVASEDFKNAERRIVFSHIPPALNSWHGELNLSNLFIPTLNEAGIDVMFSGHTHEYSYDKVGTSDAGFPVVVNDNCERMDVEVDAKGIAVRMYDPDGKLTHSLSL